MWQGKALGFQEKQVLLHQMYTPQNRWHRKNLLGNMMTYDQALKILKGPTLGVFPVGKVPNTKIRREAWPEGSYASLHGMGLYYMDKENIGHVKAVEPGVSRTNTKGFYCKVVTWRPSQKDLWATDWVIQ